MRVLHLYAGNLYGGIERMLSTIARAQPYTPTVQHEFALCFPGRLADELHQIGVTVHMLPPVRFSRPWELLRTRWALRKLLATDRPDVAICHSVWPHAVWATAIRRVGMPLVFWAHDVPKGTHWLERLAARTPPKLVLANSRYTAAGVPTLFPAVPTAVQYCPVAPPDPQTTTPRDVFRRRMNVDDDATPVIVTTSRMERWKGHELLLDALAKLGRSTSWACWIAGAPQREAEAEYFASLQRKTTQLNLTDRVRFVGLVDDVASLLAAADVHCQPNTGPEPFGIAFVEALYAGLPVVTTTLGAATEIVDETCGILAPPGDAAALAAALTDLICDPEKRHRLGAACRARARLLCDVDTRMRELAGRLESLVNGNASVAQASAAVGALQT